MYIDYFLKFVDSVEATSCLYEIETSYTFVSVSDAKLEKVLATLPLQDQQGLVVTHSLAGDSGSIVEPVTQAVSHDESLYVQDAVGNWQKIEQVTSAGRAKYAAIDVIGTIYKPTGKMLTTDEGNMPEMAPIDGWHVNVRHTQECPELQGYQVFPQTPARVWL